MSKTHAEILADIAAEVVAEHRAKATERFPDDGYQGLIEPAQNIFPCWHPAQGGCPDCDPDAWAEELPDQDAELSRIDSSWHYRLPERWQG